METKKILVIDDADYIVSGIREIFENKAGYEVVGPESITSYHQAMGLIKEHQPHAIALDMSLTNGEKEGIDIARTLSGNGFFGVISVISSYGVDEVMRWVGGYGISHYAGGKDAQKFSECVLGICECAHWNDYIAAKKACGKRSTGIQEPTREIIVSMKSKKRAIATARDLLQKHEGLPVAIHVVDSGSLRSSMELESGIPLFVVSDFARDTRIERV